MPTGMIRELGDKTTRKNRTPKTANRPLPRAPSQAKPPSAATSAAKAA